MESYYNRYISSKRKNLATLNKQDLAREGSLLRCSFSPPLEFLWWLGDDSEWVRRILEGDSEWYAPANVCSRANEAGLIGSRFYVCGLMNLCPFSNTPKNHSSKVVFTQSELSIRQRSLTSKTTCKTSF